MVNQEIFSEFPTIETDRLILRELKETDTEKLYELQSNEQVNEFMSYRKTKEGDALKFIAHRKMYFEKKWGITWVGTVKETGEFLGLCSFQAIDIPNHRAEIDGELHPKYWRTHVGQETFLSIIRFGFEQLNLHSITAKTNPKNIATIGILEKFGFKREGYLIDRTFNGEEYEDQCLYSLIKGNQHFEELVKKAQKKHILKSK